MESENIQPVFTIQESPLCSYEPENIRQYLTGLLLFLLLYSNLFLWILPLQAPIIDSSLKSLDPLVNTFITKILAVGLFFAPILLIVWILLGISLFGKKEIWRGWIDSLFFVAWGIYHLLSQTNIRLSGVIFGGIFIGIGGFFLSFILRQVTFDIFVARNNPKLKKILGISISILNPIILGCATQWYMRFQYTGVFIEIYLLISMAIACYFCIYQKENLSAFDKIKIPSVASTLLILSFITLIFITFGSFLDLFFNHFLKLF